LRGGELPDELREVVRVLGIAGLAAFRGKVKLVPPLQLGARRQRHLFGFRASDQVTTYRNHGVAALGQKSGDDVGCPRAPVKSREGRLLDLEGIHQGDRIDCDRRRFAVTRRGGRKKARGAVAAQIRNDHPIARRRQQRSNVDKTVDVVRPPVQQEDGGTVGGGGV